MCKACKGVEDAERFMFMYMPMAIATGGISTKASLGVYATKASISAGTQLAIAQDVNLIKLVGDTAFNPISGAMFGNSADFSLKNIFTDEDEIFKVSSVKNFGIGIGTDVLFMGRSGGYGKIPMPKSAQTIIGVQSELASQSMSRGLQKKYGTKK